MKLQLIAVGTRMPDWVTTGFQEYQRRFPRDMALELVEVPAGKRGKNADIARILHKEGEQMLAAIPKSNHIVSLDLPGRTWTTPDLATQLGKWQLDGRDVSLLIGGPEGLAPACKQAAISKLVSVRFDSTSPISQSCCRRKPLSSLERQ